MFSSKYLIGLSLLGTLYMSSCKIPALTTVNSTANIPAKYKNSTDSNNIATIKWRDYFSDLYLQNLIDTALENNRELMITLKEIEIAQNEVRLKKGKILPVGGVRGGLGVDKPGRYTSTGAGDATTEIEPGKAMPDPMTDFNIGAFVTWEVDIWKKLRNAKEAAAKRYLGTVEGRNFVITNLIAEIADNYYELMALDNQLEIVTQNIKLQKDALEIVKVQKEATRTTELAVQKFQAEVYKTESMQYEIRQEITETENRINMLLSRFPQPILRSSPTYLNDVPRMIATGIPSQLMQNRPDIRQAERELEAAKLDVKSARAEFYPTLEISSFIGLQAFKPGYLAKIPESMVYSLAGDLVGPIINRSAIKAEFNMANARQLQALYAYEKTVISAYLEVANQMSNIENLNDNYKLKVRQVDALNQSISISNDLFRYAKADYLEVLMTQRDALEAKMELIETQKARMSAVVNIYKGLGGGWQ